MHHYFVYILCSKRNGTLYIGMTNDIIRRVEEHRANAIPGFTRDYNVNILVYLEAYQYVDKALYREKQLKKWNREWKLNLIEKANPEWKDLYDNFFN